MGAPSIRMPLYCRMPRDFDVPALVTGSALDPVTWIFAIREMAGCKRDCRSEAYADAGHGVHRDSEDVFAGMAAFITV